MYPEENGESRVAEIDKPAFVSACGGKLLATLNGHFRYEKGSTYIEKENEHYLKLIIVWSKYSRVQLLKWKEE